MSGLVLKLGPCERLLINGAVIENGPKRGRFSIITPDAHILRLKDALHPEEANTPVRRVCYIVQLMLSGDITVDAGSPQALKGIGQLKQVLPSGPCHVALVAAQTALMNGQPYQCLKSLRQLLPIEAHLLAGTLQ
jgi:flagellar protein FlbT